MRAIRRFCGLLAGGWLAGGALAGCTASEADNTLPQSQFYYPTGMAISPDESLLFVGNANGDLQYNSGSLDIVDLAIVDQVANAWVASQTIPANCSQDTNFTETLVCDETQFIRAGAGARIGNFSTDIAVQDRGNGLLRLIVPTRGDPSITWLDFDGTKLDCNTTNDAYGLCDDDHRLSYLRNNSDLQSLDPEPFNAFVDSAGQYALVTHLDTASVDLIDSPANGIAQIVDINSLLFQADPLTGLLGSTGIAGRTPNAATDIIYIGSNDEDRIQTVTVDPPINNATSSIVPSNYFFLNQVGDNIGLSNDSRGMKFSQGGDRLYELNRDPPALQILDTSLDATGFPANKLVGVTDICREASFLAVGPGPGGVGDLIYLTCFNDGEVYVVDPEGLGSVIDEFTVGAGPYAIAIAPTRNKLYVTNYLEDTVSVIDITPGAATQDHVVLRVGIPKPPTALTGSNTGTTTGSSTGPLT